MSPENSLSLSLSVFLSLALSLSLSLSYTSTRTRGLDTDRALSHLHVTHCLRDVVPGMELLNHLWAGF